MRWLLCILSAFVFSGCASSPEQKPVTPKPEKLVRHLTDKNSLLYTYPLNGERISGYEQAEADAERVCQTKWGLHAVERAQPSCGSYDGKYPGCAVTFRCQ